MLLEGIHFGVRNILQQNCMCSCGQFCEGGYSIIVAEIKINGMTLYNCISEILIRKDGKLQARTKQ